jgi:integrase/recombinase XerD
MRRFECQPVPGDTSDPRSLATMLHRYLVWMETHHYAAETVYVRRTTLSMFLRWCAEREVHRAAEVSCAMVERYQRHLYYYRKRNGCPLSLTSQSHWLIALRSWFTWMTRERLIPTNPTTEMQLPREEKRLPRHALTESEAEAVFEQIDSETVFGLRDRAMLETLYSTGMRRRELGRLELPDIDRERGTVLIRSGKGRRDRVVPIGRRALAWIDQYLARSRPRLVVDHRSRVLFITKTGRAMHPNQLSMLVRRYVERAGITKPGGCHLFRHSAATLMLEGGADVRYIQAMLGHSSLATTEIYTHVSIQKLREVHARTHPARSHRDGSATIMRDGDA